MTPHQSAGNQGGPGSLRLPEVPVGLRKEGARPPSPDSPGPRSSSAKAIVPEGAEWALEGPLPLSLVFLCLMASAAVFKFSNIFFDPLQHLLCYEFHSEVF